MIISLIAAMDKNGLIGKDDGLPWPRLNADMKYFRLVTYGKPVIMGRKTFESLPDGPLKGRVNIVLTRSTSFAALGCEVVHSVTEALAKCATAEEVVVIGGAEIYNLFMPHAQKMYLTYVYGTFVGDAHFPSFNKEEWENVYFRQHAVDKKNPYAVTFQTFTRAST